MNPSTLQRKHSKMMTALPKERAKGKEPPKAKGGVRERSDMKRSSHNKKAAGLVLLLVWNN